MPSAFHALYQRFRHTVLNYRLIEPGDRILAAISGGKDSHVMLHLLRHMQQRTQADTPFTLIALHLDQRQPGYDGAALETYLREQGYTFHILQRDTYSVVQAKTRPGQAYCFVCSRLRRGILYRAAADLGCNKIALGHHREDALETLLLNLVFTGQLKAMPPRLRADNGRCTLIRPLLYCPEEELARFAAEQAFPILPCNLCGSQENLQRKNMRRVLEQLEAAHPGAKGTMLAALAHVRPAHLLDQSLWDAPQEGDDEGDADDAAPGPAAELPNLPDLPELADLPAPLEDGPAPRRLLPVLSR